MKKILTILLLAAVALIGCNKDETPEPTRYTVTFQTDGGSAVDPQTIDEGQKATRPTDPVKTDYTFAGWYKDAALTTLYDFNAAVTANVTIYAKWIATSATTYTVTFNSNGGSAVDQQMVEEGRKATAPPAPTKDGQDFAGWFRDTELSAAWNFDTDAVTGNITLYAKWVASVTGFTVTFETDGGSEMPAQNVSEGGKAVRPTPPVKEGEAFAGWYTEPTLENLYDFNAAVTADLTLYTKWSSVSLETLGQLLGEATALNQNRYTTESFQSVNEACHLASDVMSLPEPTQAQIVEAYETLAAALAGLIEAPYIAVAKIDINPAGIDGFVYVTPGAWFCLNASGVTADGYSATDNRVFFEITGLEAWSVNEQDIYVSTDQITFTPKDDLQPGQTFPLTIRSMDPEASHVVRSVTLKVAGTTELQDIFTAKVDALPTPSAIGYQHYDAIQQALHFYWQIPYEIQEQLTVAWDKLRACQEAYWELPERLKFSFSGNICTMRYWYGQSENDMEDPISFAFAASGAFPAGTYTQRGWGEGGYYEQTRLTLLTDGTFTIEYREADDAQGTNATPWEEDQTGTYTFTGTQTSGGVFYFTYNDEKIIGPQSRSTAARQQPTHRGLHRSAK